MRIRFSAKAFLLTAGFCLLSSYIIAQSPVGTPSKWKLTKSNKSSFEELWAADCHYIKANESGDAWVDAPVCENMKRGDSWVFHIPVGRSVRDVSVGNVSVDNVSGGDVSEDNVSVGVVSGRVDCSDNGDTFYVNLNLYIGNMVKSEKRFAVEYFDGGVWKRHHEVKCVGGAHEPLTIVETIPFEKCDASGQFEKKSAGQLEDEVLVRLTCLDDNECTLKIMPYGYIGGFVECTTAPAPKDTTRIGYVGNSFTFVNTGDFILKELAWYEGHYLDMNVSVYPGASFKTHLSLTGSLDVISGGGYDYFILQDQSEQAKFFGRDSTKAILDYTKTIASVVRYFSPKAKIIYEQTWAYAAENFSSTGSFEAFDNFATKGAADLSKAIDAQVSPIAQAFAIVRCERMDIDLYSTDFHHPSAYGAYLKACVNYLTIFKTPFTEKAENANFALDPQICLYLRNVAQRVVIGL